MSATPSKSAAYVVTAPMVQLSSAFPGPKGPAHQAPDRTLRKGDVVPFWVETAEINRLLDLGFVEAGQ